MPQRSNVDVAMNRDTRVSVKRMSFSRPNARLTNRIGIRIQSPGNQLLCLYALLHDALYLILNCIKL
jgi:hypothetical protein